MNHATRCFLPPSFTGQGRGEDHAIPGIGCILILGFALASCSRSSPTTAVSVPATPAIESTPALLSQESSAPNIAAIEGSGVFGQWSVDRYGLPAYDYTLDQVNDARAARVEIGGLRDHWSQLGNDATIANAYNHGYVQLWSQARLYEWVNRYVEGGKHYAGGFGYLKLDGEVYSTLWLDRPAGTTPLRRFGVGYFEHRLAVGGVTVEEAVTSPWGDAPALVHEVRLRNDSGAEKNLTWWEYWDVNPEDRTTKRMIPLQAPVYDADRRLLSVAQIADGIDGNPLSIFLSPLDAPVEGFEASTAAFFGSGTRAKPAAVAADAASGTLAAPYAGGTTQQADRGGQGMFALRSPVKLAPGASLTLRYVYGIAHADAIAAIVEQQRAQPDTQAATAQAWRGWLPRADFGPGRAWLNRELQWDAYMVRSSSMYEEACGHHVITQGGYYQYGTGFQIAFRDPLQHMLPLVYAEPELSREVLRYSFQQQPPETGAIAYGMAPLCIRYDLGTSNDLDFWLLLSAVEYVLGTRDLAFLDEDIPYRGGLPGPALASGSIWEHIKLAYHHQEDLTPRGPNGHYVVGATGDWSDLSPLFMQMTESVLVTAQLAYLYPRLAELAELHGDMAFAQTARTRAAELLTATQNEWTGLGWYARGYSGTRQLGQGAIFSEPQAWALLAGAADAAQAATLVGNVRRFLGGVGAPPELHGPARIGSSQSPAANDPLVTETNPATGVGDNNAVYVGGVWYALNGPLAWALGRLDGIVPSAADFALDELERNTLRAHAEAYPEYWNGVLNVDDACWSFYASDPGRCAIGSLVQLGGSQTAGQITHQPAWSLFAALKLAGIEPTAAGFRIEPHLPLESWSLRLPLAGLSQQPGLLRGYVRPLADGPLRFEIQPRQGRAAAVWVDGQRLSAGSSGEGGVSFTVNGHAGQALDWAIQTGSP